MEITIKFHTDNAAFDEDPQGEVERLLSHATVTITDVIYSPSQNTTATAMLRDSNGNRVGEIKFKR
jgi:hypothetical protein